MGLGVTTVVKATPATGLDGGVIAAIVLAVLLFFSCIAFAWALHVRAKRKAALIRPVPLQPLDDDPPPLPPTKVFTVNPILLQDTLVQREATHVFHAATAELRACSEQALLASKASASDGTPHSLPSSHQGTIDSSAVTAATTAVSPTANGDGSSLSRCSTLISPLKDYELVRVPGGGTELVFLDGFGGQRLARGWWRVTDGVDVWYAHRDRGDTVWDPPVWEEL